MLNEKTKKKSKVKYRRDNLGGLHKVVKLHGVEGFEVRFTTACSGCSGDFETDQGGGCEECGHTGKRRQEHWVPFDFEQAERVFAKLRYNKAQFVLDIAKQARTKERDKLVSDLRLEADELDKNADAILEFAANPRAADEHVRAAKLLIEEHHDLDRCVTRIQNRLLQACENGGND